MTIELTSKKPSTLADLQDLMRAAADLNMDDTAPVTITFGNITITEEEHL